MQIITAILDRKAEIYSNIKEENNEHVAVRSFRDMVNDSRTYLSKHPEDFVLVKLGEVDERSGRINTLEVPEQLVTATTCVSLKKTEEK